MPPLTGVAVNVTVVPAQTFVAEAVIETLTGSNGFTVMVTVFEVAGFPVGQVAFEVKTQVTIWPLVSVEVVNVDELVPAFTPLTFH